MISFAKSDITTTITAAAQDRKLSKLSWCWFSNQLYGYTQRRTLLQTQKLRNDLHVPLASLPEWHVRRRSNSDPLRLGYAPKEWRNNEILGSICLSIDDQCRDFDEMELVDYAPAFQITSPAAMATIVSEHVTSHEKKTYIASATDLSASIPLF